MALFDHPLVNRINNKRLQLRHGPIDLVVEAFGSHTEVEAAYQQAAASFSTVLAELVDELKELRKQPGVHKKHQFKGKVATEMAEVAQVFSANHFVTPMIAVAGAVADHVLHRMSLGRDLSKAYVNNGGDIAIYLREEQSFNVGVCANPYGGAIVSTAAIMGITDIGGIATSGWRGRSHSLGIADSVTVLAHSAATADAAATLIANAIDLPNHPMIKRATATSLNPDSDLGDRMVTIDVGNISLQETRTALESGRNLAQSMIDSKLIIGVYGSLNSEMFSLHPIKSNLGISKSQFFSVNVDSVNVNSVKKEQACA